MSRKQNKNRNIHFVKVILFVLQAVLHLHGSLTIQFSVYIVVFPKTTQSEDCLAQPFLSKMKNNKKLLRKTVLGSCWKRRRSWEPSNRPTYNYHVI